MKKILFMLMLSLTVGITARAQYISNGKIEFERKTNLRMSLNYEMTDEQKSSDWFKLMIEKLPQHLISYFTLDFDQDHSIYWFVKDAETSGMPSMFGGKGPARENIVKTNFKENNFVAEKKIYETNFLVTDSSRKLKWKIEDEIRVIAGYPCRKAVTTICDSVVIVAFYTDQIIVSGGPESISGLPGMILGMAIPRLYTTWFATKVDLVEFEESVLKESKKGKKVTYAELENELSKSLKDWGNYGITTIWWAML